MTIPMTSAVSTGAGSALTSSAAKASVDYQSFLKLLVAEMKNQDPTNPMDSTQFVAQLASFSQVEQSVQMNSRLDQIMQSTALAQADALIGREITSADGEMTGVVKEVRLTTSGAVAVLENGDQILVMPGVSVRSAT